MSIHTTVMCTHVLSVTIFIGDYYKKKSQIVNEFKWYKLLPINIFRECVNFFLAFSIYLNIISQRNSDKIVKKNLPGKK
jgi:hypothetical protein